MAASHTTTDYHFAPIPEALIYDARLGSNEVRIYAALMRHGIAADRCYPSRERLADLCQMSVSTVKRAIAVLDDTGWVERIERFDDAGAQTSNGYHVVTTPPVHGRTAPRVTREPAPGSPVTHEREQVNESNRTNTLSLLSDPRSDADGRAAAPPSESQIESDFLDWYSAYPVKKSKGAARKAYRSARKKVDAETLVTARDAFVRLMESQRVDKDYIKHPSTWLNGECWEDEVPEARNPFQGPEQRFG